MDFQDKNIIVTGGVKGIGRLVVEALVSEGARVCVFDLDEEGLRTLDSSESTVSCHLCDVTNPESVADAVERFYQDSGQIDALVNNAGIIYSAPLISLSAGEIEKHSVETWKKVIETDLSSVFYLSVNVIEKMILKRTRGVIVNISSVSASGNPGQSAYSAAKAGVDALTATWAKELSPMGIRVVGVAPGYSETASTANAMSPEVLKRVVERVPIRRLGRPDEIVDGVMFVMRNDFFNGKTLKLDGGLVV